MKRPSRGERWSVATTRQIGLFLAPTRVSLISYRQVTAFRSSSRLKDRETPVAAIARASAAPSRASCPAGARASSSASGANCLTSWFTACTVVPEPVAIRLRREPSMILGLRRSASVIEVTIASIRSSSRSSTFAFFELLQLAEAGQHPEQAADRPHAADLLHLVEEVVEPELLLADLALELGRLVGVDRLLGLLDERQHVAHAEDPRAPCGPGGRARTRPSFSPVDA